MLAHTRQGIRSKTRKRAEGDRPVQQRLARREPFALDAPSDTPAGSPGEGAGRLRSPSQRRGRIPAQFGGSPGTESSFQSREISEGSRVEGLERMNEHGGRVVLL